MFGIGSIGPLEIGIVLVLALLVFGPKRLPELGSSLGRGIREFRNTVTGVKQDEAVKALRAPEATTTPESSSKAGAAPDKRD
jgi:sec-independent protein translocase protein TatA